jgi:hypothetical protein
MLATSSTHHGVGIDGSSGQARGADKGKEED